MFSLLIIAAVFFRSYPTVSLSLQSTSFFHFEPCEFFPSVVLLISFSLWKNLSKDIIWYKAFSRSCFFFVSAASWNLSFNLPTFLVSFNFYLFLKWACRTWPLLFVILFNIILFFLHTVKWSQVLLFNTRPNKQSVRQWSGRPGFNPRSSYTKESKMVLDAALLNTAL